MKFREANRCHKVTDRRLRKTLNVHSRLSSNVQAANLNQRFVENSIFLRITRLRLSDAIAPHERSPGVIRRQLWRTAKVKKRIWRYRSELAPEGLAWLVADFDTFGAKFGIPTPPRTFSALAGNA